MDWNWSKEGRHDREVTSECCKMSAVLDKKLDFRSQDGEVQRSSDFNSFCLYIFCKLTDPEGHPPNFQKMSVSRKQRCSLQMVLRSHPLQCGDGASNGHSSGRKAAHSSDIPCSNVSCL